MRRRGAYATLILFLSFGLLLAQGDFKKGLSFYKQRQYARAIAEFEKIIQEHPDYESGYRILGDSYLKTHNYEKALEAFRNALRLKNDNFVSYYGLALAYFNSGRYRESAATLLRAEQYARTPRDRYQVYHLRGSSYFNMSHFEKAVSDLKRAVEIQRGRLQDALELGIAYYKLERQQEAEVYLKQALALRPDEPRAVRYLSLIQYQAATQALTRKEYARATTLFNLYVARNASDPDGWFNLGLAQLLSKKYALAERAFLKSAQLKPENWEVYKRLGFVYEMLKRYAASLENYRKAEKLHPDPKLQEDIRRVRERIRRRNRPA